jgi:hypothetical protein
VIKNKGDKMKAVEMADTHQMGEIISRIEKEIFAQSAHPLVINDLESSILDIHSKIVKIKKCTTNRLNKKTANLTSEYLEAIECRSMLLVSALMLITHVDLTDFNSKARNIFRDALPEYFN